MAFRCVLAAGTTVIASLWFCLAIGLSRSRATSSENSFLLFRAEFIEYGLMPTAWRLALALFIITLVFLLHDFSDYPQLKRRAKRQLFTLAIFFFILSGANAHY
jgi:hypothetical protein